MKPQVKVSTLLLLVAIVAVGLAIVRFRQNWEKRDSLIRLVAQWQASLDRAQQRRDFCLKQTSDTPYKTEQLNLDYREQILDGKMVRSPQTWSEEIQSLDKTIEMFSSILHGRKADLRAFQ